MVIKISSVKSFFPMKLTISILVFLLSIPIVHSQEKKEDQNPLYSNKFVISAGLYSSAKTIGIRVNGSGENQLIDFKEAFDLNNNEITFFGNFNWRFSKKWTLSAEYFSVKNGNKWELDEDIHWGDVTFKEGSNVKIGFSLDMYRVFVGRSVLQKTKHELGIGLGIHDLQVGAYITGDAYINNDDYNFERRSVSANAPLPNIGFWYYYFPTSKWGLTANIDLFGLTVDEYFGSLYNVRAGVNYQIFKNFGVGLSYRYFKFTAKVDKKYWNGKFNMIFQGPLLSISGTF